MPAKRRRPWLALALALLGCSEAPDPRDREGHERPHLFLITSDTLRSDHLSHAGYPRHTSPNLDAFAASSWSFSQAITLVPKTAPSFAMHLTGLPPAGNQVTSNRHALPDGIPLVSETLRDHGYDTLAFVSNPILSPRKGFDRGFDHYQQFPKAEGLEALAEAFADWARSAAWERPTFVWIHYIDPHGPYTPPAGLRELFTGDELFAAETRHAPLDYEPIPGAPRNQVVGAIPRYQRSGDEARVAWYVSQYDAEIRYMDAAFGRVLVLLRERGLYEDAGILFTSDHGESLGEHDYYFEHGWYAYDATLRVPLILKPPGRSEPRRLDDLVSNLDTAPTLLAMAGVAPDAALPGRNLLEPLAPRTFPVQNASNYPRRYLGVRTPHHKLIREPQSGVEELYDLAADPGETTNLVATQPELAARLRSEAARLGAEQAGVGGGEARVVEPTGEERELLEALGYLGE